MFIHQVFEYYENQLQESDDSHAICARFNIEGQTYSIWLSRGYKVINPKVYTKFWGHDLYECRDVFHRPVLIDVNSDIGIATFYNMMKPDSEVGPRLHGDIS